MTKPAPRFITSAELQAFKSACVAFDTALDSHYVACAAHGTHGASRAAEWTHDMQAHMANLIEALSK